MTAIVGFTLFAVLFALAAKQRYDMWLDNRPAPCCCQMTAIPTQLAFYVDGARIHSSNLCGPTTVDAICVLMELDQHR